MERGAKQRIEPCYVKYFIALFHFTITLMGSVSWLSFTPATYESSVFFRCSVFEINLLSVVFLFSTIVFGPISIWFLENYGLTFSLLLTTWTMSLGSGFRALSASSWVEEENRLLFLSIGQSMMAIVLPLTIFSPPKTVATYFNSRWRTIANTFITLATLLGVIVTGTLSPQLVSSGRMNVLLTFPFVVCIINSIIGTFLLMIYGKKEPVSGGVSQTEGESRFNKFKTDIKRIVFDKNSMALITVVGGGLGLLSAIAILIEQMLCPIGYDNKLAGYASSALTMSGICGAIIMSVICDRTKQPSTVIKFSFIWVTCGYICFLAFWSVNLGNYIIVVFIAFGFLAIGIFPIGVELAIECCHPASASTVSGFIQLIGNLQGILLSLFIPYFGHAMTVEEAQQRGSVCFINPKTNEAGSDLIIPVSMLGCYVTFLCCLLLVFFRPIYKRRQEEMRINDENIYGDRALTSLDNCNTVSSGSRPGSVCSISSDKSQQSASL